MSFCEFSLCAGEALRMNQRAGERDSERVKYSIVRVAKSNQIDGTPHLYCQISGLLT